MWILIIIAAVVVMVLCHMFVGSEYVTCANCGEGCFYPKYKYRKNRKLIRDGLIKIYCGRCR